ncbi:MAG: von Willebrand factor type A domain-containing protein, partial [Albidovulum sp.]
MTDEFDKLRTALKAPAPAPAPDAAAKAEAIRLAMENFDRHQETAKVTRPMSDRPERAGVLTGVRDMITKLTTRGALTATASIAAIGIGVMIWPSLQRDAVLTKPGTETASQAEAAQPDELTARTEQRNQTINGDRARLDATGPASPDAARPPKVELVEEADALTDVGALSQAAPAEAPSPSLARKQAPMAATGESMIMADEAFNIAPAGGIAGLFTPELESAPAPKPDTETYANTDTNPVKITAEEPVSTFSIDTDTASYSVIRSSLTNGYLPPAEAVRIEEMVNYFPYDYAAPDAGKAPFRASVSLFETPWNTDTQLLRIGLQGELPASDARPPLNLVFLIDTSGSMDDAKKLPLLKQSFGLMLGELRPEDRVAIVAYAGSAGLVLEPTAASDRATIFSALDRLDAGGSTAGAAGLELAYQTARAMGGEGHVSRVLLATDGDFNVGVSDPEGLEAYIAKQRDSGTYLSVLGFGRGNLDDATMQALAQNGNGTAAYIDTLSEAQKVLVDQLSGALFPIADDVKIQIEFNPAAVAEYRLIGYETRALAREDFNNDRVDAGEIGA